MVGTQPCGCPEPELDRLTVLLEPELELFVELDASATPVGGYPHQSELANQRVCSASSLAELFEPAVARSLADRAAVVLRAAQPTSVDFPASGLRARLAPLANGVAILLRRTAPRPTLAMAAAHTDESFWQLFEAAPLPLAIETATTATGEGASRLNRRFTELFGYTADDVPTVQHWWPLAYPDPDYRAQVRDEWFSRVGRAAAGQTSIAPMETVVTCKDGSQREIEFFAAAIGERHVVIFVDLTEKKRAARLLLEAQSEARALAEMLPICAWCKKLRDDQGYWQMLEVFIAKRTGATLTHGICPDCTAQHWNKGR